MLAEILAITPLTCFFLAILVAHSLLPPAANPFSNPKSGRHALFLIACGSSLGITWLFMFFFLKWSFYDFYHPLSPQFTLSTLAFWLRETHLFEQVWRAVCVTPARWWVSSQICTFTAGVWTVFLWKEGMCPLFRDTRENKELIWAVVRKGEGNSKALAVYVYWTDCFCELCVCAILGCS
jgi:hypothetical protein